MYISINIKKQPDAPVEEQYVAMAYTEGIGTKATASTQGKAMRNLLKKIKAMRKFSSIVYTKLTLQMGYHKCFMKIDEELIKQ